MSGTPHRRYKIRRVVRAVGCREDHQCPTGFYCDESRLSCRQCQSCEDLKRQPRVNQTSCVTSITACGACLPGLVPSPSDNKCLSPSDQQLLLPYEWAVIAVGLLLAVIICAFAVYVLRHFDGFKLYTRTSVLTPVDVEACAPQSPPPPAYNDIAVLPLHPHSQHHEDERAPFIKPISPRANVVPESDRRQAAIASKPPQYEQMPSLEDIDLPNVRETLPPIQETASDISNEDPVNSTNTIPPEIEESIENGRQEIQTPSAKILQNMQDGNNNSDTHSDCGEETKQRHSLGGTGTAFVINVFSNNTSAQQANQLNL